MYADDIGEFRKISVELREALWRDPFCRKKFSLLFLCDMLLVGRDTREAIDLGLDVIDGVDYGTNYFVFDDDYEQFRDFLKTAIRHYQPEWSFPSYDDGAFDDL